MSLFYESYIPENPQGIIVNFVVGGFKKITESNEFKNFIVLTMTDGLASYFRTNRQGYFIDPMIYVEQLSVLAKKYNIDTKNIMTWGTSRAATMALFVGLMLGVRCILAIGPQIDALGDIAYIRRHGAGLGGGDDRAITQSRYIRALYRSVADGKINFYDFLTAIENFDLKNVVQRADDPLPRIALFIANENASDQYALPGFIAAIKTRKSPLDIRYFPGFVHAVLRGYRGEYVGWFRAFYDNRPFKTPEA